MSNYLLMWQAAV